MGSFTMNARNMSDNAKSSIEDALMSEEQRRQKQMQKFKDQTLMGTPTIDKQGASMASIAARFIDNSVAFIEDPAFDCIQWQIDWSDTSGLFADVGCTNSALRYLKETGETERYVKLQKVIVLLKRMFDTREKEATRSYYLTSVDGLGSLNENYTKVGMPSELTLNVIDDVKWSTRFICDALNFIYYDNIRQIEVLPRNLRRFSCMLNINDVRDLSKVIRPGSMKAYNTLFSEEYAEGDTASMYQKAAANGDLMFVNENNMPQNILITIPYCNLVTTSLPDSVSNTDPAELTHALKLVVYRYKYTNIYAAIRDFLVEVDFSIQAKNSSEKMTMKQLLMQAAKGYATKLVAGYIDSAKKMATSYAMSGLYQAMDNLGVTDIANKLLAFTKPDLMMQKFANVFSKDEADKIYRPNLGKVDNQIDSSKTQYKPDLGNVDE